MHKQAIKHKQAIIGGGYLFTENACWTLNSNSPRWDVAGRLPQMLCPITLSVLRVIIPVSCICIECPYMFNLKIHELQCQQTCPSSLNHEISRPQNKIISQYVFCLGPLSMTLGQKKILVFRARVFKTLGRVCSTFFRN